MSEKKWTKEQKTAIEERKRTLLVSAAAGSGKTATLTERIIRSLTDEDSPSDISKMIIVTFTRAAAAELRERISSAVASEIEKNPKNARLRRQLLLLPSAKICTIDSFCAELVRQNAVSVGISPNFRVCDENERLLLLNEIVENLIEECYSDEDRRVCNGEDFCDFVDDLVSVNSEGDVGKILLSIYEKIENFTDRAEVLKGYRDSFGSDTDFFDTEYGRVIYSDVKGVFEHYRALYELYTEKIEKSGSKSVIANHLPAYRSDLRYIKEQLSALEEGYSEAKAVFSSFEKQALKGVKSEDADENDNTMKALRLDFLEDKKACVAYFSYSNEHMQKLQTRLYNFHNVLYSVISELDRRFREEKQRRGICDYGDLEHYTLELLYDGEEPSLLARKQRDYYECVYIDEYQDINPIQHKIFEAITREDNCFMVGDIKQSIYSFRRADPDIFASMKKTFPKIEDAKENERASIFMSSNFRCDKGIIDFSNAVFDSLFGASGESIGYENADRLSFSKQMNEGGEAKLPTVALIAGRKKKGKQPLESLEDDELFSDEGEDLEAEYVADEIKRLVSGERLNNGERIRPSDIAILLRTNSRVASFASALEKRGISSSKKSGEDFFASPEVMLALSLLNTVDNPHRDVYLMGTLCSPIYGFTSDELTLIRLVGGDELSLYECLRKYVEAYPEFEKGRYFLSELEKFRKKARNMPVNRLLLYLYKETGMLSLCGDGSEAGHKKLLYLYNYAGNFEASSFKGLYNFICYINEIRESEKSFSDDSDGLGGEGVRIMTVHASKGLEFPVCFVSGCGRQMKPLELKKELVFDSKIGFSPKFFEKEKLVRAENPVRLAIAKSIEQQSRREELRVLYVALTRARERLYVTGSPNGRTDNYLQRSRMNGKMMSDYTVLNTKYMLEWILSSIARDENESARITLVNGADTGLEITDITDAYRKGEFGILLKGDEKETPEQEKKNARTEESPDALSEDGESREGEDGKNVTRQSEERESAPDGDSKEASLAELLKERFDFKYPYSHISDIPAKLSVSRLYPSLLDEKETGGALLSEITERTAESQGEGDVEKSADMRADGDENSVCEGDIQQKKRIFPQFILKSEATGAERGTATHLFMQFADFAALKKVGVRAELERLVAQGFISQDQAELVFENELELFAASELLSDILSADNVRREFRFNSLLPAEMFSQQEEKKEQLKGHTLLVQGVIDCILEYNDGSYTVIDYKTDRLTPFELSNSWAAEKKLRERHREQLTYYSAACEKMYGRAPKEIKIYSLPLGRCIKTEP